ncbi:MAG: tRNA (adenosine(37)-N6)-threonylcarbamoyltransferase complex dimerization subunit type 1 TsaB [Acidobacteria bacterium RBG_16_68_9]|nr:MAG: tRNA (adenosine(37)-N6)-threonylcarbamoyltransferase complex dimerization subunit type 1 TsaB [Acidobacteria bacterium RBG_16_68_9]
MRVLGIDTATWTASVGVVADDALLAERSLPASTSHAVSLLSLVGETLEAAGTTLRDLDLLAVSIGPGSFTGLRIGLSVTKGLALATGIPIVGVPTLEALAYALGPREGLVCPLLDARKQEVYAATFRWRGRRLECVRAATVLPPGVLAEQLIPPCTVAGDGVDAYGAVFHDRWGDQVELLPSSVAVPRGSVVAALGAERFARVGSDHTAGLEPAYVRPSEAERNRSTNG